MRSIKQKVLDLMLEQFPLQNIEETSDVFFDLNGESIDLIELSIELEDAFGCQIKNGDVSLLRTPKSIVSYLESHL